MLELYTFIAVVFFAVLVAFVCRLAILDREPFHSLWLSFAGGIAIAYCLDYLLPKLAKQQVYLAASTDGGLLGFLEHHVYLVTTLGLVIYFGLNRAADHMGSLSIENRRLRALRHVIARADVIGGIAYLMLVGYLMSELQYLTSAFLYAFGMGLHIVGLAHIFRERYPGDFDRRIRWYFVAALFAGGAIGWTTEISSLVVAIFTAFLAGGIIPTALREELPHESKLRFRPFLAGVVLFATLTLIVEFIEKA